LGGHKTTIGDLAISMHVLHFRSVALFQNRRGLTSDWCRQSKPNFGLFTRVQIRGGMG